MASAASATNSIGDSGRYRPQAMTLCDCLADKRLLSIGRRASISGHQMSCRDDFGPPGRRSLRGRRRRRARRSYASLGAVHQPSSLARASLKLARQPFARGDLRTLPWALGSASEARYPARLGSGGALFVERRSIFVLHFACKLLRFQCDELRCFVFKMLISKG
jgi:hypothetical protein